jgi:hypothetical protein
VTRTKKWKRIGDAVMQTEVVLQLLVTNLVFSVKISPLVIVVATLVRSALLLTGRKRALVSWTRNTILSIATIVFLPGTIVNTGVRYAVCSLFGIDLEGVGGGSTYAELNLFLKVDRPPRVAVLVSALYVSTVASVFIGFSLLFLPVVLLAGAPVILLCWYMALCRCVFCLTAHLGEQMFHSWEQHSRNTRAEGLQSSW